LCRYFWLKLSFFRAGRKKSKIRLGYLPEIFSLFGPAPRPAFLKAFIGGFKT